MKASEFALTILGDYTPEEHSSLFTAFDNFQKGVDLFTYLHYPRFHTMPHRERLCMLSEYHVDIFRGGLELFVGVNPKSFLCLSDTLPDKLLSDQQRKTCNMEGELRLMPDSIDGIALVCNGRILKKYQIMVPTTWEELHKALRQLQKRGYKGYPLVLHNLHKFDSWWAYYLLCPMFSQAGYDFTKVDMETFFEDKAVEETIAFFRDLLNDKLLGIMDEQIYESRSEVCFAKEQAAFMFQGPWVAPTIITMNPQIINHIEVTTLSLKNKKRITQIGGRYFGIPATSKRSKQALAFLTSFLDKGSYYDHLASIGKIPGIQYPAEKLHPLACKFSRVFSEFGEPEIIHQNEPEIQEYLGNRIGDIFRQMIS